MKFILQLILIVLITYLLQMVLPWWVIFLSTGLVGFLIDGKSFSTFLAGFLGVGTLWFIQAYLIDIANDSILSAKVAGLFSLTSSIQIMLVTAFIGALCGGFGALTGHFLRGLVMSKNKNGYYSN